MSIDTLSIDEIIEKVLNAKLLSELIDTTNFKKEFRSLAKKIYPDLCKHPKAKEATQYLTKLRDTFKKGIEYEDDAGTFAWKSTQIIHKGDPELLKKSYENYKKLMSLSDSASRKFQRYLPKSMKFESNQLIIELEKRSVPISGNTLDINHANWILSRMLEFNAWLHQIGYTHCGLSPESVLIVPETHGIVVCSFYHMTKIGQRLRTISAKYQRWYSPSIFDKKIAIPLIDNELAKKNAIYLIGDTSGVGIKLKKDTNSETITFLTTQDYSSPYESYKKWRNILEKNFGIKYWHLEL